MIVRIPRLQGSCQQCSTEQQPAQKTYPTSGNGPTIPLPLWSRRARRARKAGPGSRPLPEGIEVCCRPRARDRRPCCWPAPASFPICRHPVRLCEQPAQCRAPEQAVGPEAAHRATLDPNITRPRGARVRFGRARALVRETRTPHRAQSGKRSFQLFPTKST